MDPVKKILGAEILTPKKLAWKLLHDEGYTTELVKKILVEKFNMDELVADEAANDAYSKFLEMYP